MTNNNSGTAVDMYARYFPGEPYTISFEPTPEQSAAMIRLTSARTENNTEAEVLLMMLGVIPSESAFNPTARDAWTKKKPRAASKADLSSTVCVHGHNRDQFSRIDAEGKWRCRECDRIAQARLRAAKRETEAA
jgi:hypothetical protein